MADSHSAFIKTPKQLIVVVVAAFVVPILVISLLAALVTSGKKGENTDPARVVERIRPVGTVVIDPKAPGLTVAPAAAAPAATPAAAPVVAAAIPPPAAAPAAGAKADGKATYDTACAACHNAAVAGAPKLGDKVAWAPRLTSGKDTLYASAIKGKGAMPPKGGQTQLSDDAVKAAVDYMAAAVAR